MSRNAVNFWLDSLLAAVTLALAMTGSVLHYVLPPGTGGSLALFGLARHDFGALHFYLAMTAMVLAVLHVWLHWAWVCGVVGKACGRANPRLRTRLLWGLAVLAVVAVLLVGGVWWAAGQVSPLGGGRHMGRGQE
jgi:hypothetical protein